MSCCPVDGSVDGPVDGPDDGPVTDDEAHATGTPWAAGRLDGRAGSSRLLFGHTYEDPAVEDALFPPTGMVLCIAGAGDTARALATSRRRVLAVDVNPHQLAEVRRRLAGRPPRPGTADRLLQAGRALLVPLGWRPARLARFCRLGAPDEQVREWRRLTGPVVRRALAAGLSPGVLRLAYGPSFTRLVPARFGDRLIERIGRRIARGPNHANPWLAQLLTGARAATPPERPTPDAIELRGGDVADVLARLPARSLDGISLSNVLDGPGPAYRERLLDAARRATRPGAPIVVRTLREPSDAGAAALADTDRSLIWGGITVHRA